jgi:putative nucleotidyltransferase with HDIG domain
VICGGAVIAHSLVDLWTAGIPPSWLILVLLTVLSGSITVKIPSVPATISVSETFVFTAVLLFGPSAGTVTVALDGLVISLWLQRRKHQGFRATFNMAAPSISIWVSAQVYFLLSQTSPLSLAPTTPVSQLLLPLAAFTALYFLLNSWLIAFAIAFEKNAPPSRIWKDNFLWLGLNFFGGASVAALLVAYTREISWTAVGIIVPLLVISYLTYKTAMGRLEDTTLHLTQLNSLYVSTIETLARAIDARDQVTHGHIRRVQSYATELARDVGVRDDSLMKAIEAAALLHDLGKLRVPEHILNKPGKLTAAEFEKIRSHSSVGAEILSSIDFHYPVVPIVRHHHENWDGTGYPDGLAGTEIPIGARILAVVDCYDALTSDRPYRPSLSEEEATRILVERRGTMYDPVVVDCFLKLHGRLDVAETGLPLATATSRRDECAAIPPPPSRDAATRTGVACLDVSDVPGWSPTLRALAEAFTADLVRTTPTSLCIIYLYREGSDDLVAACATGIDAQLVTGLRIELTHGVSGWVAANRQTVLNSDPCIDLRSVSRSANPLLKSCLSTPLLANDTLVGVLSLYSTGKQAFDDGHRRKVESLARQLAKVLRDKQADIHPPPTLESVAPPVVLRSHASSQSQAPNSAAVLLVEFSDGLEGDGDKAGAAVEHTASLIQRSIRAGDVVLRYGPDQLLVILPQTDSATARTIAERIGCDLESAYQETDGEGALPIRVQIGVAFVPRDGVLLDSVVVAARRRLTTAESVQDETVGGPVH